MNPLIPGILAASLLLLAPSALRAGPFQQRLIAAAEKHLGKAYVFGGRDGRWGCLEQGKRTRCAEGIDCQSLIFFAMEEVQGRSWRRFLVMPSKTVQRGEWGRPVPGMSAVLRKELQEKRLRKGDALMFLLQDYNLDVDPALWTEGGKRYGVWHTGLVHRLEGEKAFVIHAKPGDKVLIEPLTNIEFEALFVLRFPEDTSVRKQRETENAAPSKPKPGSARNARP